MSAWELETAGRYHHVMRFQVIAPIERRRDDGLGRRRLVDQPRSDRLGHRRSGERPDEVEAVAMRIASRGWSARVATDVAIAFAVSWNPLM